MDTQEYDPSLTPKEESVMDEKPDPTDQDPNVKAKLEEKYLLESGLCHQPLCKCQENPSRLRNAEEDSGEATPPYIDGKPMWHYNIGNDMAENLQDLNATETDPMNTCDSYTVKAEPLEEVEHNDYKSGRNTVKTEMTEAGTVERDPDDDVPHVDNIRKECDDNSHRAANLNVKPAGSFTAAGSSQSVSTAQHNSKKDAGDGEKVAQPQQVAFGSQSSTLTNTTTSGSELTSQNLPQTRPQISTTAFVERNPSMESNSNAGETVKKVCDFRGRTSQQKLRQCDIDTKTGLPLISLLCDFRGRTSQQKLRQCDTDTKTGLPLISLQDGSIFSVPLKFFCMKSENQLAAVNSTYELIRDVCGTFLIPNDIRISETEITPIQGPLPGTILPITDCLFEVVGEDTPDTSANRTPELRTAQDPSSSESQQKNYDLR
ncbi:unnamed protein product [Strongylus vulgaris]|uniref:Uncharacterized protein n=1 Tax=Strongylus vulgaris TaxID=40348 RepID=A0A3P7J3K7_STRVU|nr:unnamed protein product [Strongylus vulgaris]